MRFCKRSRVDRAEEILAKLVGKALRRYTSRRASNDAMLAHEIFGGSDFRFLLFL